MNTPTKRTHIEATMNNKTIAYCRVSTKDQSLTSQIQEIHKHYSEASILSEHGVSGTVPAKERPEFSKLLDNTMGLRSGDTLIVWWFDRIGRDYHDSKEAIQTLLKRGVMVKTINQSLTFKYEKSNVTQNMLVDVMLSMLAGMADNERQARLASAQAGREALSNDEWKSKFKGKKANTELHSLIISELNSGLSIRKTAVKLSTSVSTVQRVKKLLK